MDYINVFFRKEGAIEKPYRCEQCLKTFSRLDQYQNHLTAHTGDDCFKCDYCSITFAHKGKLKLHLLGHSGGKPHNVNIVLRNSPDQMF
jgi:KRAB domain-containing zinc finger protein